MVDIQLGIVRNARRMCQQVPDRHHTDSIRESRKKRRQGIVVREAVLFCEHHDRCRGDRLRQRRQTGSRFGCIRPARVAIGQAECAFVEDVALLGDEDLAGEEMLIVESRHEALDLRAAVADGRRPGRAARRKGHDKAGGGMKQEVTPVHDTDSFPWPDRPHNFLVNGAERLIGAVWVRAD